MKIIKSFSFIRIISIYVICALFILIMNGCQKDFSPEEKTYIAKIEKERIEKNEWMKNDPSSPFNFKGKVPFHNLKYFDVDPAFRFRSKLFINNVKDTVTIYGTKGEPREVVKYGYVIIKHENIEYKINVYEGSTPGGIKYHSIWFTDMTTNKESYGVGRYIDFELSEDPNHIYDVDFNLAYNPYCAYSAGYSCAIPTKEDYISIAIEAGEKKFHD